MAPCFSNTPSFHSLLKSCHYSHRRNQEFCFSFSVLKLNMEEQTANILYKVAQKLLLLFCLSQTLINCDTEWHKYGSFALIEYTRTKWQDKFKFFECGAVWISEKCVLTAASCFEKDALFEHRPPPEDPLKDLANLKVLPVFMDRDENEGKHAKFRYKVNRYNPRLKGTDVVIHPLYQRKGDMTVAFDFAVVKVDKAKYDADYHRHIPELCVEKNIKASKWVAVAVFPHFGYVLASEVYTPLTLIIDADEAYVNVTTVDHKSAARRYYIDPDKQFTVAQTKRQVHDLRKSEFLDQPLDDTVMNDDNCFGGPVWANESGCVAGIMSFGAVRTHGTRYITSTRVEPAIPWINYVKNNTISDSEKKSGMKFWEEKLCKEQLNPFGPERTDERAPGNPVNQEQAIPTPMPTATLGTPTEASKSKKAPKKSKIKSTKATKATTTKVTTTKSTTTKATKTYKTKGTKTTTTKATKTSKTKGTKSR